jgi:hypothetical protein
MPDPRHRKPDAPFDVVREALLEPVPCPSCGSTNPCRCIPDHAASTDVMARRILERLTDVGALHVETGPPPAPTEADIEQAAQWLAGKSRHPRYTQVADGWRQLMDSEHNVEHAHATAVRAASPASQQQLADLAAVKALLIGWHETRRATPREEV